MNNVDILIPVYRPSEELSELLNRLYLQTVCPNKIILLWTVPSDSNLEYEKRKMKEYLRDNLQVKFIPQCDFDHGGTRRLGMTLSDAEYVLCMTQDAIPKDNVLIENLLEAFNYEGVAAAYARQLPRENASTIESITREFNYPATERIQNNQNMIKYGIKNYFCSNVCAMYKKMCYNRAGGFVKKTIFNEDMIMASYLIDLGYSVRYVPTAQVIHSHYYNYIEQYKRNFDLAVSQQQYKAIFERVPSESEGIHLVVQTAKELAKQKKLYLVPELILQSGAKYLGYKKGKRFEKLTNNTIKRCTMNRSYWKE